MKRRRFSRLVPLLVIATGCFHIKYTTRQTPSPAVAYDEWHHDFIYGLVEVTAPVNVGQICTNGFAVVENEETFVNGLVAALTGSLWTPTSVNVSCSAASKAAGDPSPIRFPVAARGKTAKP